MCILSSIELLSEIQTYMKFFTVKFIHLAEIDVPFVNETNYFLTLSPL